MATKKAKKRAKKKRPTEKTPAKKKRVRKPGVTYGRPKVLEGDQIRRLVSLDAGQWAKLEQYAEKRGTKIPRVIRDWVDRLRV